MKSYDVAECGAPLKLFERPTPQPTGSEVLLRVLAAGICHSDIHIWEGHYDLGGGKKLKLTERGVKLPLTMGHETVGEVVALGPDVPTSGTGGVKSGDKRLVFPWLGCGSCAVCRRGEEQLCLAPRFLGVFRNGGYADHIMVPHARYLLGIGDLKPAEAAPYACSGLTAYGALKRIGPVLKDEPVVVIGAGGLGLMCLGLLKAMGGKGAIVVDTDPAKREAALKAGAVAAIDGAAPDALKQLSAAAPNGVWSVIDFVGATATAKLATDSLTKGGKLVIVGLFGGDITLPLPFIPMRAMTIQGSYVGSLAEAKELLELVKRTRPPAIPITTHPLDSADAMLQALRAGRVIGRAVLTP
jgi:D-arabinose 1-dehydrogenase-like Zn-dependent alcohol dehydrogenase